MGRRRNAGRSAVVTREQASAGDGAAQTGPSEPLTVQESGIGSRLSEGDPGKRVPSDVDGRAAAGVPLSMRELGRALRSLRHRRGSSLSDVAEAVGLSPSFLSLVETGKSDISLNRLHKLAGYHGVGVADLLPPSQPRDPDVVTPTDRRAIQLKGEGLTQYLLAPDAHRSMLPLLVSYEPGGGVKERHKHRGEEFIHVLSGQLILDLEDSEDVLLGPGDSVYFSSERAHALRNPADTEACALAVITPPTW